FSLSLDNMVAGTGLGLLDFPPVFSAAVFGTITFLMSYVGLYLGKGAARFIPIRSDLLTGMGLLIVAVMLALGFPHLAYPD
ncbi:MAG TPA: manganese efflux pump, partial [Ktedonobacteraceae bacterium]|nr:manganese efflux pump [Ktedonobacteraceae bacterium]